jgi:hypothetical protein
MSRWNFCFTDEPFTYSWFSMKRRPLSGSLFCPALPEQTSME